MSVRVHVYRRSGGRPICYLSISAICKTSNTLFCDFTGHTECKPVGDDQVKKKKRQRKNVAIYCCFGVIKKCRKEDILLSSLYCFPAGRRTVSQMEETTKGKQILSAAGQMTHANRAITIQSA